MSNRYGLASMPAAQYAREGRNNVPHRRTVAEMRRHAEARGARDFTMFRTGAGRPANGFCHFTDSHGCRVARYHETDILTVTAEGDIIIRFDGWHTISTRERFNAAAREFGLLLRAVAVGKADVTGFGLVDTAAGWYPGKPKWRLDDGMDMDGDARGPLGYRELRIPGGDVPRSPDNPNRVKAQPGRFRKINVYERRQGVVFYLHSTNAWRTCAEAVAAAAQSNPGLALFARFDKR